MSRTRITIPIADDAKADLQKLADVRRSSLAAVCSDLLEQISPVASQMADALKMAQNAPAKALAMMNENLESQLAQVDQYKLDIDEKLSPKATRRKYVVKKRKTG